MIEVKKETPLKDIVEYVDFRDFFHETYDEVQEYRGGNIHLDCPDCGAKNKCMIYSGNAFCHRCRKVWSIYYWLVNVEGMDQETVILTLQSLARNEPIKAKRGERINHREVKDEDVEYMNDYALSAHQSLNDESVQWWHSRGVSDKAIKKFQLGEKNGWYVIPLRDDYGITFGVKKRWKGTREDSPHNTRYECLRGSKVQYAPYILRGSDERVAIIVGGEIKGLALWSYLQEYNLPWNVVATACGENPWISHWNEYMRFERVAVWCDRDETGYKFVNGVHANYRSDCAVILPDDSDAKAVDDYILSGHDPIKEIRKALNIKG